MSVDLPASQLKPQLSGWQLWAIALGMVISGQYFGWNQGLAHAGAAALWLGFAIVTLFYAGFMWLYLDLALALPQTGGVMWYCQQTLGRGAAAIAGYAALIEYFFAVAAISLATGAYCHGLLGGGSSYLFAAVILVIFALINMMGVGTSARVEMISTLLALLGLIIVIVALGTPHWASAHPERWQHRWQGLIPTTAFLLWLYLGIEGSTLASEETRHPTTTLRRSIGLALLTLVIVAVAIVGQVWSHLPNSALGTINPLSSALKQLYRPNAVIIRAVNVMGLCGLLASLNGLLIAASRQCYALARAGYAPLRLARLNSNNTPFISITVIAALALLALFELNEAVLLRCAILGALGVYCGGIIAWFAFQRQQPLKLNGVKLGLACLVTLLWLFCFGVILTSFLFY